MSSTKNANALMIGLLLISTMMVPVVVEAHIVPGLTNGSESIENAWPDYMRFISINSFRFDPLGDTPDMPPSLMYGPDAPELSSYHIVQFDRPITQKMKVSLEATGATIIDYLSYNAFVVKADANAIQRAEEVKNVRWIGAFEPAYKLGPRLSERYDEMLALASARDSGNTLTAAGGGAPAKKLETLSQDGMITDSIKAGGRSHVANSLLNAKATGKEGASRPKLSESISTDSEVRQSTLIPIEIVTFERSRVDETARALGALGGSDIQYSYKGSGMLRATVDRSVLNLIARIPGVMWIDRYVQPNVLNDIARWVVQSGDPLNYRTPVHDHGIDGKSQTVTVGDTGIDFEHDAFEDPMHSSPGPSHRKVTNYYVPAGAIGDLTDNDINHGTHVSGSVAGDDGTWYVYDGDPFGSNTSAGPHDGQAFAAKLQVQDLSTDGYWVNPPNDYHDLFQPALNNGSWIHTNSWGSAFGSYTEQAAQTDDFLWDNKEFIVLFSAGNSGSIAGIISPFAAAKNVIGVGASLNGPGMEGVASFSSRGPAADGRIKPDVMAPGVSIWSARGGDPSGVYDDYFTLSGTSMSTPTVAGSVALIRQYYMDGFYPTGEKTLANSFIPSSALVKATLINSAVEMTGSGAYDSYQQRYPNNNQGWGRVLLDEALYFPGDARGLTAFDNRVGISTGAKATYELAIGDDTIPVEITLVWTDYPAAPYAGVALVNDLNLVVTAPDGTRYIGNVYSGMNPGESVPNPAIGSDSLNNVESVLVISNVQTGLWRIEVAGYSVPMGPQPYALVMTGGIASKRGVIGLDHETYRSDAKVVVTVVDTDLNANPNATELATAHISSTTEVAGETVTLTETGPATSVFRATVQLQNNPAPIGGDGVLQVQNRDVILARYHDADDGQGGSRWVEDTATVDDDAPIISNVMVTNVRFNRATILWTTDERSDSTVYYGNSTPPTMSKHDSRMNTKHEIRLSGLKETTTYYFAVKSVDEAGNTAYDDNGTTYFKFTTPPRPPLAPASPDWPTFHNNPPRQGSSPSAFDPPIAHVWSDGPHTAQLWNGPVFSDGVLVSASLDGYIRARNPFDGSVIWQRRLGGLNYYSCTPTIDNGVVYAAFYGGAGGSFYALDLFTGQTVWSLGTESGLDFNARVALTASDGLVFGSTWTGEIFALDQADGSLEWKYMASDLPFGGPSVDQGIVYMGCVNGLVVALDEFSGELLWSTILDEAVTSAPLVVQSNVYVGTYAGTMYALDQFTGSIVWQAGGFDIIDASTPAYDGSTIFFGSFSPGYHALDADDGGLLWSTTAGESVGSALSIANGYLYGTSWDGLLYVLDSSDGSIKQLVPLNPNGSTSSVAIHDGWVFTEDSQGYIHAFFGRVPVTLSVVPPIQRTETLPGSVVNYRVNVTNLGVSGPDTFDAQVHLGPLGWSVGLFKTDGVTPLSDTDSDGVPDTGSLSYGVTANVVIRVTVPGVVNPGDTETTIVSFVSSRDTSVHKNATLRTVIPPPGVAIGPRTYFSVNPGDHVLASLRVSNTGAFPDTIDLRSSTALGWYMALLQDDGLTPLTDTDSDGVIDSGLVPGLSSVAIKVAIDVPAGIAKGDIERAVVSGRSSLDTNASGSVTIVLEYQMEPNDEWPTYHNDNQRRGASLDRFEPPLEPAWIGGASMTYSMFSGPVLANGRLFTTNLDGYITARDPYAGSIIWQRLLGDPYYYTTSPTVADGIVFVAFDGEMGGTLYALDEATGTTIWSLSPRDAGMEFNARTIKAYSGGVLYATAWSGEICAVDAVNGSIKWAFQTGDIPFGGIAIGAGMAFVGTVYSPTLYAIDIATGGLVWSTRFDSQLLSVPLVAQGALFVNTYEGSLYRLDMMTGDVIWSNPSFDGFFFSTPAYGDGRLYLGSWSASLYAVDPLDGAILWETPVGDWVTSSPAFANGFVYGVSEAGLLYSLDAADGKVLDVDDIKTYSVSSSPAISGGWVWVEDQSGSVHAFTGIMPVGLSLTPAYQSRDTVPGSQVDFEIAVKNVGTSGPDTFDAKVNLGPAGWGVQLLRSDGITPLSDTDGDTVPDTGPLPTGASAMVIARMTVPAGAVPGQEDTATLTFTSSNDIAVHRSAMVRSFLPPPGVEIGPSAQFSLNPGDEAVAAMNVRNTGSMPDTFDLTTVSRNGWTLRLLESDGVTLLTDTDSDGLTDTGLVQALSTVQIVVVIEVPEDATNGTVEVTLVKVTSSLNLDASDSSRVVIEVGGMISSNEWPTYHQNSQRTGVSPMPHELPLSPVWVQQVGYLPTWYGPVIDGGTVYFTTELGRLFALDVRTGAQKWAVSFSQNYVEGSSPTVAYGFVYAAFTTDNGTKMHLHAVDEETGEKRWEYVTPILLNYSNPWTTLAVGDGMLFWYDCEGGHLFANDAFEGDLVWSYTLPGVGWGFDGPTYWGGVVFAATDTGDVIALDGATGQVIWSQYFDASFQNGATVANGALYLVDTYSGAVYALDTQNGDLLWTSGGIGEYTWYAIPTVTQDMLYFGTGYSEGGLVLALDAYTGARVWSAVIEDGPVYAATAYSNGVLYVAADEGPATDHASVHAFDAVTGQELGSWDVAGGYMTSIALAKGFLVVGDNTGRWYGFGFSGVGTPTRLEIVPDEVAVATGSLSLFEAHAYDGYENELRGLTYSWTSGRGRGHVVSFGDGNSVAVYLAGTEAGLDVLYVQSGNLTASANITIIGPGTVATISVTPVTLTATVGSTSVLKATALDDNGSVVTDANFAWSASSGVVTRVDAQGSIALYVAPLVPTSTTVTVTSGGVSKSIPVTVVAGPFVRLVTTPSSISLRVGEEIAVSVLTADVYGNEAGYYGALSWTATIGTIEPSDDGRSATFRAGDEEGTGTVTVTGGGQSVEIAVTITKESNSLAEQLSSGLAIGLIAAVVILAILLVMLIAKNRQLTRRLRESPRDTVPPKDMMGPGGTA